MAMTETLSNDENVCPILGRYILWLDYTTTLQNKVLERLRVSGFININNILKNPYTYCKKRVHFGVFRNSLANLNLESIYTDISTVLSQNLSYYNNASVAMVLSYARSPTRFPRSTDRAEHTDTQIHSCTYIYIYRESGE